MWTLRPNSKMKRSIETYIRNLQENIQEWYPDLELYEYGYRALFRQALFRQALFRQAVFRQALFRQALFRQALPLGIIVP